MQGTVCAALPANPRRLKGRSWFRYVEVVQGDVTIPSTLARGTGGRPHRLLSYSQHDVWTWIYIAGIGQRPRLCLCRAKKQAWNTSFISVGWQTLNNTLLPICVRASKQGRVLREGNVPVTEFRAGVITGSGSISFEMIRFMTELFPIVPGPLWMKNKSQPIAIQNVIDYLFAALTNPNGRGGSSRSAVQISLLMAI